MSDTVELSCPKCGLKIAVPAVSETIHVTCPKCRTSWDWPIRATSRNAPPPPARPIVIETTPIYVTARSPQAIQRKRGPDPLLKVACFVVLFIGLLWIIGFFSHSSSEPQQPVARWSQPLPLPKNDPVFTPHNALPITTGRASPQLPHPLPGKANRPENAPRPVWDGAPQEPLPETGDGVFLFDTAVATSRLKFVPNIHQDHVLLKVFEPDNAKLVCWVFIRDTDYVEMDIPPGDYRFRIATGSHWYGETNLFGPYAAYSAISNVVTIRNNSLYTINCNPDIKGSLVEARLEAKDF